MRGTLREGAVSPLALDMLLLRSLGYLWSLPNTLIGLLLLPLYWPRHIEWSEGCLEVVAGEHKDGSTRIFFKPSGQTFGWLIFYATEEKRQKASLRVHERVHVTQAFWGGLLFAVTYLLCFAWSYTRNGFRDWYSAYMRNPFEIQAYRIQAEFERGQRPNQWGRLRESSESAVL